MTREELAKKLYESYNTMSQSTWWGTTEHVRRMHREAAEVAAKELGVTIETPADHRYKAALDVLEPNLFLNRDAKMTIARAIVAALDADGRGPRDGR
jgi:hypothetical protein